MSRLSRFFGFKDHNENAVRLARIMMSISPIIVFTLVMSSTFYMIFIADQLGGGPGMFMQGMALIGVLVVVRMVVQTLLDYPTGTLGDMIGHRFVIASAYIIYAIVFYLTSILTPETPFLLFVVIYVLLGIAASQESGAWGAWFDNNYRVAAPADVDRTEYGVFFGRFGMITTLLSILALIPGAILAVIFSRMWVFQLSAILCFATALAVLRYVTDFPEVQEMREKRPSAADYVALLKSGAGFIVSDPFVKYVLIGEMVVLSCVIVWSELIVFPLLFAYLITDVAVAGFRTLLRVPGLLTQERAGVWSRRFRPEEWLHRFRFIQNCGFVGFIVFAAIMYVYSPVVESAFLIDVVVPFTNFVIMQVPQESLIPTVLMLAAFVVGGFFYSVADILLMRLTIDFVPSQIRNSVYSLSPTIAILIAIPQIALFGATIQHVGFPITLSLTAIVSLVGVLMIRKGLTFPVPITEERKREKMQEPAEIEIVSSEDELSDNPFDESR